MSYSGKPMPTKHFKAPKNCRCAVERGPKGDTSRVIYLSSCPNKNHQRLALAQNMTALIRS